MASALPNPFDALASDQGQKKKAVTSSTQKNKNQPTNVSIKFVDRSGRYHIGSPARPSMQHDNGHLERINDKGEMEKLPILEPTLQDRILRQGWEKGADLTLSQCAHMDNAVAAYKHFLNGAGKDWSFSYAEYIHEDGGGWSGVEAINRDFIKHMEIIGENREKFRTTSTKYDMNGDMPEPQYSYPETENWIKALGAHFVWISADVGIAFDKKLNKDRYHANVTIHAEDRYNFNPNSRDIATGIPDSANGRFERTGLAHQFTQYSTLKYELWWVEGDTDSLGSSLGANPMSFPKSCSVTEKVKKAQKLWGEIGK